MSTSLHLDVLDTEHDRALGTFTFDGTRVTVGRGGACDLVLPDSSRVVSKRHAEIWLQDGTYYLRDLESRNHTFLNAQRIPAQLPCALSDGDILEIGLYQIEVRLHAAAEPPTDERRVPPDERRRSAGTKPPADGPLDNPLDEPAALLAEAVRALRLRFAGADLPDREGALEAALHQAMPTMPAVQRAALIDAVFRPRLPEEPTAEHHPPPSTNATRAAADTASDDMQRLLDVVLPVLGKLAAFPLRFKHEFIGQTIVHSREMEVLFSGDAQQVRAYLFDPEASAQTQQERRDRIRRALETVLRHEVAMIDGYRAAAQHGLARLLDHVDPATIGKEVAGGLPFFNKGKVLDEVAERCAELRREDWSTAERRIFRPAFIRAYDARMREQSSPSRSDKKDIDLPSPF